MLPPPDSVEDWPRKPTKLNRVAAGLRPSKHYSRLPKEDSFLFSVFTLPLKKLFQLMFWKVIHEKKKKKETFISDKQFKLGQWWLWELAAQLKARSRQDRREGHHILQQKQTPPQLYHLTLLHRIWKGKGQRNSLVSKAQALKEEKIAAMIMKCRFFRSPHKTKIKEDHSINSALS